MVHSFCLMVPGECDMPRAMRTMVLAAVLGGCSGGYILTIPDQVAPAGGDATPVIRLRRNEIGRIKVPVRDALMQFRLAGGPLRGAYTDEIGYAGAVVPTPDLPGRYVLSVRHVDPREGDDVEGTADVFAWPADAKILAVDLDCLPYPGHEDAPAAAEALRGLAPNGYIVYFSRDAITRHERLHELLGLGGYPVGPILLWQRERMHILRRSWRLPKIVVESRLVSQLEELRKIFPGLHVGVCDTVLSATTFSAAGMECLIVSGQTPAAGVPSEKTLTWSQLAEKMR